MAIKLNNKKFSKTDITNIKMFNLLKDIDLYDTLPYIIKRFGIPSPPLFFNDKTEMYYLFQDLPTFSKKINDIEIIVYNKNNINRSGFDIIVEISKTVFVLPLIDNFYEYLIILNNHCKNKLNEIKSNISCIWKNFIKKYRNIITVKDEKKIKETSDIKIIQNYDSVNKTYKHYLIIRYISVYKFFKNSEKNNNIKLLIQDNLKNYFYEKINEINLENIIWCLQVFIESKGHLLTDLDKPIELI